MAYESVHMNPYEVEYHRFGPWLLEIETLEQIPPQYLAHESMILSAEFAFKVPVNKDRKDLSPGQLMYKEVVLMSATQLMVMSAVSGEVKAKTIDFKDIISIAQGGELLGNYIELQTAEGTFKIAYHTVSLAFTNRIISHLRQGIQSTEDTFVLKGIERTSSLYESQLYKYLKCKEAIGDPLSILVYQSKEKFYSRSKSFIGKQIQKIYAKPLEQVMFLSNGRELIIASGDVESMGKSSVNYSYRHMYIPLNKIDGINKDEDLSYLGKSVLKLNVGESLIEVTVATDLQVETLKALLHTD